MKFLSIIFLALSACTANAQEKPAQEELPLNQFDESGRRTGTWWLETAARMGEPQTIEFGNYINGLKNGNWYKMGDMGNLISIEHYKKDVLDGEAKYFDQGVMYAIGYYRGLNPDREYDTIMVVDPETHLQSLRAVHSDRGSVKHGIWKYYDPGTGHLIKEEEYVVDELIYRKEFDISAKLDSVYLKQREENLPHKKQKPFIPPAARGHSNIE